MRLALAFLSALLAAEPAASQTGITPAPGLTPDVLLQGTLSAYLNGLTTTTDASIGGVLDIGTNSNAPRCDHYWDTNHVHDFVLCAKDPGTNATVHLPGVSPCAGAVLAANSTGDWTWTRTPRGSSPTPTAACGGGAGDGSATCTVATQGTNNSGKVTVVTHGTPAAGAVIFILTFDTSAGVNPTPGWCTISPASNTAATLAATKQPWVAAVSAASLTVYSGGTALDVATYSWGYACL